ncbi:hypothetical protein GEMRC1_002046 [Eukaryota sp. GEM-RC1]
MKLLYLFLVLFTFTTASLMNSRFVSVTHGSEFDPTSGVSLGHILKDDIMTLYSAKLQQWKHYETLWDTIVASALKQISTHAPRSLQELKGMAIGMSHDSKQSVEFFMNVLLRLNTEYELLFYSQQHSSPVFFNEDVGKCTGFVLRRQKNPTFMDAFAGQNNDEQPSSWLNGTLDKVISIHYAHSNKHHFIYTHPGYLAYMGSNNEGLGILWEYVNTGELADLEVGGVPTQFLIREVLFLDSTEQVTEYLANSPRFICNNFQVASLSGVANIELTPSRENVVSMNVGDISHANHYVFDDEMIDRDLVKSPTTVDRYKMMRKQMTRVRGDFSLERGKEVLSVEPVLNYKTLASMVFDLKRNIMTIRFKDDNDWQVYYMPK